MTRATMIAEEFGWIGFAADIYGADMQGEAVDDFAIRREQAGKYRGNNTLFYGRIQAAVDLMKAHEDVAEGKIAIIGCEFWGATEVVSVCLTFMLTNKHSLLQQTASEEREF